MVLETILEDSELGFNGSVSEIKPKTPAESTARSYLPRMRAAVTLELGLAMTEAIISGNQLHNDILDGNEEKLKNVYSQSLPTIHKAHIFDGIDVSFIERDILKKSARCRKSPFSDSSGRTRGQNRASRSLAASPFGLGDRIPKTEEIDMQKKFREFEKDQHFQVSLTQLKRHPPPLKLRSRENPTSYNDFLTLETEPARPQVRSPLPEITVSSVKMTSELDQTETYLDLSKVREHVDRIKELLGRKDLEKGRTSEKRGPLSARRGLVSGGRRSVVSRRVNTVGPEVLGSWDRAGSALSTRPGIN
ncbi:uncharacterized protein LOC134813299 [Bolinopsis microptera]|uniref:uncharacterized protein LOC134813299 n=1 Tax=Bolinopsis microptera TaxID=2820187 RepID=UPI003078E80D